MPELRNLNVEWLSLVDRAAVRDPSDPSQPQRFLLWKKESGEREPEPNLADLQAEVAKTTTAIKKIAKRIEDLTKTEPEPLPPDAGGPTAEEAEMTMSEETKTAEELGRELSDLSKSEGGLSAAQAAYRKIGAAYLEQLSPQAYAAWMRGQESIGVTYPGAPLVKSDTEPLDPESLKTKAIELGKRDPTMSPYDAMIAVMKQDRAGQAAYLKRVRGR